MSSISPVSSVAESTTSGVTTSALSNPTSADSIQENFMTLLLTQLRHQNPMEPMRNEELSMQLATMSQLKEIEGLSSKFDLMLHAQHVTEASTMIGKYAEFTPEGTEERTGGTVSGIEIAGNTVTVQIGPNSIDITDIASVSEKPE